MTKKKVNPGKIAEEISENFGSNVSSVFPSLSDDSYSIEDDDNFIENEGEDKNRKDGEDPDDDSREPDNKDDDESGDSKERNKKSSPLKLLLEMMVNPIEGWKKIRRARYSAEETAIRCFYPLVGIASAASFTDLFYSASASVSECMVKAVSTFVAFFFGNFLILIIQKALFPKSHKEAPDSKFGKEFVMYNLATLAIFLTLFQLLPMIGPVLAFLPLWTIYLTIRGSRFFRFSEDNRNLMTTINCLAIIGIPIAIFSLFEMIL